MYTAAKPKPLNTSLALDPPSSPANKTSAQAVPSGYGITPCSLTIKAFLNGTMNKTPSKPPIRVITPISINDGAGSFHSFIQINNAGIVKIAPDATDSPADPIV